jgi:hypothetical protein
VPTYNELTSSQLSIMFPRPPAPPVEHKPTLPLPFEIQHDVPGLPPFEVVTQKLLAMAETAGKAHLMPYLDVTAYAQLWGSPSDLLLTAINPTTGDSIVHCAAATGNINVLNTILYSFGPNFRKMPERERQLWVLVTHQNLAGDTALHAAARTGSVRGTKGVYRLFHMMDCDDVDDSLHNNKTSGQESADPDYPVEAPVEYFDWSTAEDEPDAHLPALDFVCTQNRAEHDAAEEARSAGHEDLAVWLDGLVARLDRDGMKGDDDYMQKARLTALKNHWYHGDKEEK